MFRCKTFADFLTLAEAQGREPEFSLPARSKPRPPTGVQFYQRDEYRCPGCGNFAPPHRLVYVKGLPATGKLWPNEWKRVSSEDRANFPPAVIQLWSGDFACDHCWMHHVRCGQEGILEVSGAAFTLDKWLEAHGAPVDEVAACRREIARRMAVDLTPGEMPASMSHLVHDVENARLEWLEAKKAVQEGGEG